MEENFIDNYEHIDNQIFYTYQNVPGPGIDVDIFQNRLCVTCECVEYCNELCTCMYFTGTNYSADGRLLEAKMLQSSRGVIECNDLCGCNRNCRNRLVQFGPALDLEVFHHDVKGFALRTLKPRRRGEFICEYAGEIIGKCEAKLRVKNLYNSMNYIFVLKEHSGNAITETIVDPTSIGNIGRYINHSCQANAVIVPVRFDSVVPHLAVFAFCDIPLGEEITFDYSGGEEEEFMHGKTPCCCGSKNCRKFIPFNPQLL